MAKIKIKNLSASEILENIPRMPRESKKRIMELYGDDLEIIKAILKSEGIFLKYCSYLYQQNKELVTIAVTQNGRALCYADSSIRQDPELVQIALHTTPSVLEIVDVSSPVLAYIALTSEAVASYPLVTYLTRIADLFKDHISMLLEVAHTHKNTGLPEEWYAAEHRIPKKYHQLFELVLKTDFDAEAWTYVRQAILLDPEPFINPNHILRQIMQTPDDWRPIAESILYNDFLRFKGEDPSADILESLTFDLA